MSSPNGCGHGPPVIRLPTAGPTETPSNGHATAYDQVEELLRQDRCVVLDGGVATEIERFAGSAGIDRPPSADQLWGTWALDQAPEAVIEVHRRYVEAGCNVISTNTWSILSVPEFELRSPIRRSGLPRWMDVARLGIKLSRQAIADAESSDTCAVAFAMSGEMLSQDQRTTIELLTRVFEEDPPDLVLMETLSLIHDDLTFTTVETLLDTGLPLWLSFRRCLHGVCGVHGQHWGGPEGDLFGRAARRFEEMGVAALLMNCIPVDHVPGMIACLRDFTDMPLGVYPNLGYLGPSGWRFDDRVGPEEFAGLALQWWGEGAQVVGGCCGVTPEHIAAARHALWEAGSTRASAPRAEKPHPDSRFKVGPDPQARRQLAVQPWQDEEGRRLYPLPFPELRLDPGVSGPTQQSLALWQYLFRSGVGNGKRCLDMGTGTGILAIQLALNGAHHVDAIALGQRSVENAMTNAFRNGVSDRVAAAEADIYLWEPDGLYDVIVANLLQMPVDPFGHQTGHRPLDFWGRNVLDHFFSRLPRALTAKGVAYVTQLSILSQHQSAELFADLGLTAQVVDFQLIQASPMFHENKAHIARVEDVSDAYHLEVTDQDYVVVYVLELSHQSAHREPSWSQRWRGVRAGSVLGEPL